MTHPAATGLRAVPCLTSIGSIGDPAITQLIVAHPALGRLSAQDRDALRQWSRVRSVKRKDMICRLGDAASTVILVLEGYLKLSTPLLDGNDVVLDIVGPGECTGEMAALQGGAHDRNISALTPCRLLMIDTRRFRQACDRHPEAVLALLRLTGERVRRLTEQLVDSHALSARARLAKALLYLSRLPAVEPRIRGSLPLRLSQGELGAMTGVCREVVNLQLGVWREAGWIAMSGGAVTSIDTLFITKSLQAEMCDETERSVACA